MGSRSLVVLVVVLATGACEEAGPWLPGEDDRTPCAEVIPGCEAERLENVVLRGDDREGGLSAIDGFDVTGILSFDDALEVSWTDGYRGRGETVQVILGAADADRLHWGTGTHLYYAVQWEGACPLLAGNGPPGYQQPPSAFDCDATITTSLDARTGEVIGTGQNDPP